LWLALGLTATFMLAEIGGALLTGSLALLSDAAHMFTDVAALAISLTALEIGKRHADHKRTFGYYRFEILAATFNALLLCLVGLYILYEAYQRTQNPAEIQSTGMLVIAAIGLLINLVSASLLQSSSSTSLNVKSAYLEAWSDLLGSLAVILGAVIIRYTGWTWVDTLLAVGIGLWVLPRTWILLKESINILLQGVPEGIDITMLEAAVRGVRGVTDVHNLHLWALTSGKNVLSVHLVANLEEDDEQSILGRVTHLISDEYHIDHITVQVEAADCRDRVLEHVH
jgi:cobalt-zinc-cadmium efflux system protein